MSIVLSYPARTFQQPTGYSLLPITTDIYTDIIINNLYIRFAACYANMMYNYTAAKIKGCDAKISWRAQYLLMSLYVLRNWYNANEIPPSPSTNVEFALLLSSGTSNIYFVSSSGSMDTSNPLTHATSYSTYSGAASQFNSNAGYAGWSFTNISSNLFNATVPAGWTSAYPNFTYLFVTTTNGSSTFDTWVALSSYGVPPTLTPCIPYSQIQTIIENCIQICGETQCQTLSSLFSDNNFVPLGQVYNHPPTNISNLFPNFYFE